MNNSMWGAYALKTNSPLDQAIYPLVLFSTKLRVCPKPFHVGVLWNIPNLSLTPETNPINPSMGPTSEL